MPSRRPLVSLRTLDVLLQAGLQAHRLGQLGPLSSRHARLARHLQTLALPPILGILGDAASADQRLVGALRVLLLWGLEGMRPDRQPGLEGLGDHAWLHSTSWRPLLSVACHYGLLEVPAFPGRYRRRQDEPPIDNLCGLWAVGSSTYYRYLEKGRRQLVAVFAAASEAAGPPLALRRAAQAWLRSQSEPAEGWPAWHLRQAQAATLGGDVVTGLWHHWQARDAAGLLELLKRHALEAATARETDGLLAWIVADLPLDPLAQFELSLRWATLWRHRQSREQELDALNRANRQAHALGDALPQGMALAAMARFHEADDVDRALALYEEAAGLFTRSLTDAAAAAPAETARTQAELARALVRWAWLLLRRNNPRAMAILNRVEQLHQSAPLPGELLGLFEQTRAEYWRCMNEPRRSADSMQRALVAFERLGDQRAILNTYRNLSLVYGELREHDRAVQYGQRVLDAAREMAVESDMLAGTLGNMGVAFFYQGDLDAAIEHYDRALSIQEAQGLKAQMPVSHYNLAEAHYRRFQAQGDPADEQRGDMHAAAAARLSLALNTPQTAAAAQSLKREVLGMGDSPDRLLPSEFADHFQEMAEVQQLRERLAGPVPVADQIHIRLQIARAYAAVASKEREAALALAQRHGLGGSVNEAVSALRQTFERELTREQRLDTEWGRRAGTLLRPEQRRAALARLLTEGSISKSIYAEVCGVSPATASKHLVSLAEWGLLSQSGKGPSTRYRLPESEAEGGAKQASIT